jgi:hypothetical protein
VSVRAELTALDGFVFSIDGRTLGAAGAASEIPVDVGDHRLEARAHGYQPWSLTITIPREGERRAVEIPMLQPSSPAPGVTPVAPEDDGPGAVESAGYIVSAVGVAAVGVGGYFGISAISHKNERDDLCEGGCRRAALDEHRKAEDAATTANVFVGIGAGLMVTGVLMVVLAPDDAAAAQTELLVQGSPSSAALQLHGTW